MKKLRLFVESFGRFLSVIGTFCLLFIMMYIVCSVLSRAVIGKPLLGTFELGATFLPLIAAFYYINTDVCDRHIRATIIFDRLTPKLKIFLNALYSLIAALIFAMVGYCTITYGIRNLKGMCETSVLHLPIAPFHFVYSFAILSFAFYMVIKTITYAAELIEPTIIVTNNSVN
jgi:TRAP-type C4-dicarboxylate transport system permease small subunit